MIKFGVLAHQERHNAPIKVKFDVEEYIMGSFSLVKFGPDG